ncbi:hypothetical protein SNE510_30960 [Streptomyces sp. NE5-10]|nr:hypothetical protein SNE510_30960 [Streptomyces sp. NE5-10]
MNRILIAEDEERIASFVEKGLRANGFTTSVAADGDTALALARTGAFDLVVLDIGLPGRDGFTVLRELREARLTLPVLVLTARDSVRDTVAGLEGGADDWMTRPFRFEELLARIRLRLRTAARAPEVTVLRSGDLGPDLRTRRARSGDRTVDLTAAALVVTAFAVPATSGRAALALPVFLALAHALAGRRRLVVMPALLFPTVVLLSAVATLIGAGAHLITVGVLLEQTGESIGFTRWLLLGLPLAVVSSPPSRRRRCCSPPPAGRTGGGPSRSPSARCRSTPPPRCRARSPRPSSAVCCCSARWWRCGAPNRCTGCRRPWSR